MVGPERPFEERYLEPPLLRLGLLPPGHVVDELRQAVLQVIRRHPGVIQDAREVAECLAGQVDPHRGPLEPGHLLAHS